jgi:hypothetical protein
MFGNVAKFRYFRRIVTNQEEVKIRLISGNAAVIRLRIF